MDEKQVKALRAFVNASCGMPHENRTFPGSLPISLERRDFPKVFGEFVNGRFIDHVLSFKTDGERRMIGFCRYENRPVGFTASRKNFAIEPFPVKVHESAYLGTVLDVEIVPSRSCIVLFDACFLHGVDASPLSYPDRLAAVQLFLKNLASVSGCSSRPRARCSLQLKTVFPEVVVETPAADRSCTETERTAWMCKKLFPCSAGPRLRDSDYDLPNDGYIYTPVCSPMPTIALESAKTFKWKPLDRITVEFLVVRQIGDNKTRGLQMPLPREYAGRGSPPVAAKPHRYTLFLKYKGKHVSSARMASGTPVSKGIYECGWRKGGWRVDHVRTDKSEPNNYNTAFRTIQNLREGIRRQDLHP